MRNRSLRLILGFLLILLALAGLAEEEEISFNQLITDPTEQNIQGQASDTSDHDPDSDEPSPTNAPNILADGSVVVTVTAIGDVTIGHSLGTTKVTCWDNEYKKQGNNINFIFRNVKDIFEDDDLTIANFECVLQDESEYKIPSSKKNNQFLFLADPAFASVLPDNSVEAVTIENNHIMDFGEAGRDATIQALKDANVVYSNHTSMGVYETNGVRIAMFAHQTLNQPFTSEELAVMVKAEIAAVRDDYDIIIESFHWGNEKDYTPVQKQINLGRAAIDAGADLVLGHHSHRMNPIEQYKGKYIVYSLGNGSFGGNNKPSDMLTFIFQARFKIRDGEIIDNPFRIIPSRISSRKDYNDFALTPLTDQSAINTTLDTLTKKANIKNLDYAVTRYPLEWE